MAIDIFQVGAQLGAPASKVSNVRYDNSGQQAVIREAAQTGRIIQAGVEHVREQIIRTDVLQTNNEYVKRTNELRMQLMQKKEKSAASLWLKVLKAFVMARALCSLITVHSKRILLTVEL